ncbi:unnamed protein product [Orchesella dallaii]|uniref:Ig-like domain-containing protein n=1 Tax=Orchesella dallaii TaxID=48710 RepID=A0ABP1QWE1_9HEXA
MYRHLKNNLTPLRASVGLISSLKLTATIIPYYAVLSRPVTLHCNFSLENDSLYALKWYKDGHEFFRFKPSDDPPVTIFPLAGVSVNPNNSDLTSLELDRATLLTRGTYRCEISADAPSFQTVYEEQYMRILALPVTGPSISGTFPWYNLGENFSATCTVEKTFPPPQLTWFINDIQIDSQLCECMISKTSEAGKAIDGTTFYSSKSQVKFQLEAHYFRDGSLTAECRAMFPKSNITLQDTIQSNVKAGLGLRHYAADLFSNTAKIQISKYNGIILTTLIIVSKYIPH